VPRRLRCVTILVALLPLAAACSDGGTADAELPPGSAAPAATTPARAAASPTPGDPVLAAYLRFWDAVVAAHEASDPQSAALARAAGNPELGRVRATVSRNKAQKLSLRGEVTHDPEPAAVSGATATLEDCYDISGWNPVNLATGERVDVTESGGTGRYRARWTLRRSGSSWLVVDQKALGGC
jgi:hypothetical protein